MKTFFLYQDKKHEYTLTVTEDCTLTLYRSHSSDWNEHCQGEKVATLIDDGNDITIKKFSRKMDYSESDALRILLNFNNNLSHMPSHYNVIDAEKIQII